MSLFSELAALVGGSVKCSGTHIEATLYAILVVLEQVTANADTRNDLQGVCLLGRTVDREKRGITGD